MNLPDEYVEYHLTTTVDKVRDWFDGSNEGLTAELDTALENAQGRVFEADQDVVYVVIEIRKQ